MSGKPMEAEIKVRVPVEMKAALAEIAAADKRPDTKISHIARDAIGEFLARRKSKPRRSAG